MHQESVVTLLVWLQVDNSEWRVAAFLMIQKLDTVAQVLVLRLANFILLESLVHGALLWREHPLRVPICLVSSQMQSFRYLCAYRLPTIEIYEGTSSLLEALFEPSSMDFTLFLRDCDQKRNLLLGFVPYRHCEHISLNSEAHHIIEWGLVAHIMTVSAECEKQWLIAYCLWPGCKVLWVICDNHYCKRWKKIWFSMWRDYNDDELNSTTFAVNFFDMCPEADFFIETITSVIYSGDPFEIASRCDVRKAKLVFSALVCTARYLKRLRRMDTTMPSINVLLIAASLYSSLTLITSIDRAQPYSKCFMVADSI